MISNKNFLLIIMTAIAALIGSILFPELVIPYIGFILFWPLMVFLLIPIGLAIYYSLRIIEWVIDATKIS